MKTLWGYPHNLIEKITSEVEFTERKLEQNYKVTYHTITSLWVVFGLSTRSTSQSTPCWNWNRKSRFNALSTCEWQLYPQESLGATLISLSALTRFWVGKIGANQVWKVLCPAPNEIRRRTFLKVYMTSKGHLETTYSHIGSCLPRHFDDPKCSGSTDARWQNL